MPHATGNAARLGAWIAAAADRPLPPEVANAARMCLADWFAVALGAAEEPAGRAVRTLIAGWGQGSAAVLFGAKAPPAAAALANGTLAHCLDFDDTYVPAITHVSAPLWAATLAVGEARSAPEVRLLRAFVTGFEVVGCLGDGLGQAVTARGWHGTGVFGRLGAAAAAGVLLGLDAGQAAHALALAATQAGGLTASFGSMAKPFHAGKAAMDGVIAAEAAALGLTGNPAVLEHGGGLDGALIQDGSVRLGTGEPTGRRILNNSFKPYAACHLIHPAIDAAFALRARGVTRATALHVRVTPLADQVTGGGDGRPATALAAKFDLRHCIAMAFAGHAMSAADFRDPWRVDPALGALAQRVTVQADPAIGYTEAVLTAETDSGPQRAHVAVAKGHPGNPMDWDDMRRKWDGLVAPAGAALFDRLRHLGAGA
jgi:2-methylcitrate dehydratase PrpD